MTFVRWLFRLAGVYGLLVLLPMYFMEERIGQEQPPPITHPENYYGFIGLASVWQLVYLLIGHDPLRYRPMMLLAVLAKSSFGIAVLVLYGQQRVSRQVLIFSSIDLMLAVLFLIAWWRCGSLPPAGNQS
jgi:hypothetical protein